MKKPSLITRAAGFCLSLFAHAVLLYFIFTLQFKIEIFPMGRVEDVFIADREIASIPQDMKGYLERLEKRNSHSERSVEYETAGRHEGSLSVEKGRAVREQTLRSTDHRETSPNVEPRFRLDLRSEELNLPDDYEFNLSDPVMEESGSDLSSQRISLLRELAELRRYYPGILSDSQDEEGGDAPSERRSGLSPVLAVNLRPWADQVIGEIHKIWLVPLPEDQNIRGKVRASVTITKKGRLTGSEIIESSGYEVIDRSVMEVLESGLALTRLPDRFPGEEITVVFQFEYGY